jgi:tetratricopeptide (TPR) repeat protein
LTPTGINLNSMIRIFAIVSLAVVSFSLAHSKQCSAEDALSGALGLLSIAHSANADTNVGGAAVAESSNSQEEFIARGESNRRDDFIVAAINDWKKAVGVDPNCSQAWLMLGDAYVDLRQRRDALECYKRALALQPLDVRKETTEQVVKKIQEEIRIEEADPLWANCSFILEHVRLVTGPSDTGFTGKLNSRRTGVPSESSKNGVAAAAREAEKSGDYEKAVRLYEELIASDPGDAANFVNMAVALELLGRHEEAIRQYEEAIRIVPKNVDVMIAIGDIHSISMGDDKTALYWYAKAIQDTADPARKKSIAHRISKFMLGAKSR